MANGVWRWIAVLLALSACSSFPKFSSFNLGGGPLFETPGTRHVTLDPYSGYPSDVDPRPLAAAIGDVVTERTPTGLIIRLRAQMPGQPYRGVQIVESRRVTPGLILLEAHLQGPAGSATAAAPAAIFLSNDRLAGISEIRLLSAGGTVTLRP